MARNISSDTRNDSAGTFRLIVGEVGNEQGHVQPCRAKTFGGAKRALRRELDRYQGDGWGRIEEEYDTGLWSVAGRTW